MLHRPFVQKVSLVTVAVLGFGSAALAHVGDHSRLNLADRLGHSLTSIDHVMAIVAVGLWASLLVRLATRIPVRFAARGAGGAIVAIAVLPLIMP